MNLMQKNEYMRARLVVKPEVEAAKAALDKERTVDTWYDYGMALSHAGRSEEAVDAYSQGLVEYPFSSMLYFARGRCFMGPKQYDRAIADFTMALRLEPDVYLYWYYGPLPTTCAAITRRPFMISARRCALRSRWSAIAL